MIIPHAVGYTKEDLMHLYKSRVIRRTMELKNVNSEIITPRNDNLCMIS